MMAWRLRGSKTLPQCLTDDSDSDEEDLSNPKDYVDGVFMGFVKRPAMTVEKQYPDGDINMVRFTGTEKPVYGECPREFIITCQTRDCQFHQDRVTYKGAPHQTSIYNTNPKQFYTDLLDVICTAAIKHKQWKKKVECSRVKFTKI